MCCAVQTKSGSSMLNGFPAKGSSASTVSRASSQAGCRANHGSEALSCALAFGLGTAMLLVHDFHRAGGRVVINLHSIRSIGHFADVFLLHQLIEVLGETSLVHLKHLDGLVQRCDVRRLARVLFRRAQRTDVVSGRLQHTAAAVGGSGRLRTAGWLASGGKEQSREGKKCDAFHGANVPPGNRIPSLQWRRQSMP